MSVAMLHGAHADVIDRAATALLVSLEDQPGAALGRVPLHKRLEKVGVKPGNLRHVRFTRPGYEFAVRAYFWKHFPELHDPIATWVRDTIDSRELTEAEREDLARGFVDQCLERRYQGFWTGLVEDLTADSDRPAQITATAVLMHGLGDQKSARAFRQQIYDWSTTRYLSYSLAGVLAAACDEMTKTHPRQALVRLHHVVRRYPAHPVARETLTELAISDPWLLSYFLARLAGPRSEWAQSADAGLFLDIADAHLFTTRWHASRLITQRQIADDLAAGWALAFTRLPAETWGPAANTWLRFAADNDTDRDALLDVLVGGADGRADLLSRLLGMAHRIEASEAISLPFLEKISAAQGVSLS